MESGEWKIKSEDNVFSSTFNFQLSIGFPMPIYTYSGLTAQGRTVSGVIDADNPKNARLSLRRTGIFPTAGE